MTQPRTVRSVIEGKELLSAPASTCVCDAARLMKQRKVGAILVLEDGKLAGIFTERDALFRVVADGRDPTTTTLAAVMTRDPRCIHPDKPFAAAISMMHDGQFRRVPVVENDRPIGMVGASDAMGPELENFMFNLIVADQAGDVLA